MNSTISEEAQASFKRFKIVYIETGGCLETARKESNLSNSEAWELYNAGLMTAKAAFGKPALLAYGKPA